MIRGISGPFQLAAGVILAGLLAANGPAALAQDCIDRGPFMTIAGDPPPPHNVHGEIGYFDSDFNWVVEDPGDDVGIHVFARAMGQGTHGRGTDIYDNTMVEVSIWRVKAPDAPPQIGILGPNAPADEAPHTSQVVSDNGSGGETVNGGPSYTDQYSMNRTWSFVWSTGFMSPAPTAYGDFTVHFYQTPGDFWFAGESQDDWLNGGFSFWSSVLGNYHMLLWGP